MCVPRKKEWSGWKNFLRDCGGLVVDGHIITEHVQVFFQGMDVITKLTSLHRLKAETMTRGPAITSFWANSTMIIYVIFNS